MSGRRRSGATLALALVLFATGVFALGRLGRPPAASVCAVASASGQAYALAPVQAQNATKGAPGAAAVSTCTHSGLMSSSMAVPTPDWTSAEARSAGRAAMLAA